MHWTTGYTQSELDAAQERYGLTFPSDLVDLLRDRRPNEGFDWRSDDVAIRKALLWPLEGLIFDVEENDFWLASWGERPSSAPERARLIGDALAEAPKLIPILGHRYIPEAPNEPGNPVFSVYQTDVIYYGANLEDYFAREFCGPFWRSYPVNPSRRIPFWSDLVELNFPFH